jgi:hypothetical protein
MSTLLIIMIRRAQPFSPGGVLEGKPDHRDMVLSDEEHAANAEMTLFCSRSKSNLLVLDLCFLKFPIPAEARRSNIVLACCFHYSGFHYGPVRIPCKFPDTPIKFPVPSRREFA